MTANARLWRDLPSDRAGRLAYFQRRIEAAEASDDLYPYKLLYAWADPSFAERAARTSIRDGRVVGRSTHHETLRRAHVLRAWCAQKIGWRNELRVNLCAAHAHKRLALAARKEGR